MKLDGLLILGIDLRNVNVTFSASSQHQSQYLWIIGGEYRN